MLRFLGFALAYLVGGCVRGAGTPALDALSVARDVGPHGNAEAAGEWLLEELLSPGGTAAGALAARKRVATFRDKGLRVSQARALDAEVHGRSGEAIVAHLDVLTAARVSSRTDAPLHAWYSAGRAEALRGAVANSWRLAEPLVQRALDRPGNIGWRARLQLLDWYAKETDRSDPVGSPRENRPRLQREQGCVADAAFAGPFGRSQPGDHRVHFAAEGAPPWPLRFAADGDSPRAETMSGLHRGCALFSKESHGAGVHYVQTFVELDMARDVLLAVAGAFSVRVDDVEVLQRDQAAWGSWPRLGVALRLRPGRHRILARIGRPETSIRLLALDGRPLPFRASSADDLNYGLTPPELLADPNPLDPHLRELGVRGDGPGMEGPKNQVILRYFAATLAAREGHQDVAAALLQPLVEPANATPIALAQAAQFVEGDPVYTAETARTLAREFQARALAGDQDLWGSALWLTLDRAGQARPADTSAELESLVARFPAVPALTAELAAIEAQLGWTVEHAKTVRSLAERFPENIPILEALLLSAERQGQLAEVDALTRRIAALDPTNELAFRRALARGDFDAAVRELRRIEVLRPERRDVPLRIAELLVRSGKSQDGDARMIRKLELALEREPQNPSARLALADGRHAMGDRHALEEALLEAIRTGSDTSALHQAIELVDGATALEPYRKDGLLLIRETESKGLTLPGTAARILDYAALWIAADGSARMLEHTILRVQSREGIARHTEQPLPQGAILTVRTIKKDGQIFEPEIVPGKPTVTMPHLEVGDYIETESIESIPGDGVGARFRSPRWFFREPNVSYHLSQFVVISPKSRPLTIETSGNVPPPVVTKSEGLEERRWTVTEALALPEEASAPPIAEFLPSVLVGWGADWLSQLAQLSDARAGGVPEDPRLLRIARTIASGKPDGPLDGVSKDARARRIYRWVVDTLTPGDERWPARIVTSKNGDLTEAFIYLCKLAGVDARLGVIRSRLAPPSRGPLSDLEAFSSAAVRVVTEHGPRWMLVGSRFAPYGFLPNFLAGQPAILVDAAALRTTPDAPVLERERTTNGGAEDGGVHRGKVTLAADGSAKITLVEEFHGRYAIAVRTALSRVEAVGPMLEQKRRTLVEQRMIGPILPGARVLSMSTPNLQELDAPLTLKLELEVPNFARRNDRGLEFDVPFLGSMAPLVALPSRETPLYVAESARSLVELEVVLPPRARLATILETSSVEDPRVRVRIADRLVKGSLHLKREVELRAGRVTPLDYPGFQDAVGRANGILNQPVRVEF